LDYVINLRASSLSSCIYFVWSGGFSTCTNLSWWWCVCGGGVCVCVCVCVLCVCVCVCAIRRSKEYVGACHLLNAHQERKSGDLFQASLVLLLVSADAKAAHKDPRCYHLPHL
jgi:hypothetical protein